MNCLLCKIFASFHKSLRGRELTCLFFFFLEYLHAFEKYLEKKEAVKVPPDAKWLLPLVKYCLP